MTGSRVSTIREPGIREQDATGEMNEPDAYALGRSVAAEVERLGGHLFGRPSASRRCCARRSLAVPTARFTCRQDEGPRGGGCPFVSAALADAMKSEAFDALLVPV